MALTGMQIDSITPRGGPPTTPIVVLGGNFGTIQGAVVFDPLGAAVSANVTLWQVDRIEFDVPSLILFNQFVLVNIQNDGGFDSVTTWFWLPVTGTPTPIGNLPDGLDYQFPAFEEGAQQNEDDPEIASAADFNRMLDRVLYVGGAVPPPPAFEVTLTGAQTVEVGQTVTNPQFNASYNRAPTTASLADDDGNPPQDVLGLPNPLTMAFSYVKDPNGAQVQFTLTADEGGPPDADSVAITWLPLAFWGNGPPGLSTEADIKGLPSSALAADRLRTFTATAAVGEKLYYAYPVAYGAATFFVNGFEGGFLPPSTVSVTNAYGVTQDYYLYESAVSGLGTVTVEVR